MLLLFFLIWLRRVLVAARGISFPDQGSNPGPLHWEREVLPNGFKHPFLPESIIIMVIVNWSFLNSTFLYNYMLGFQL